MSVFIFPVCGKSLDEQGRIPKLGITCPIPQGSRLFPHLWDAMGFIPSLIKELAHLEPSKSVPRSKTEISIPCVNTVYLSNGVHKNAGKCKLSSWNGPGTSVQ